MALVLKDRVKETTTTTGTGSFALAGAVTGYDSFGQIGSGNTTYYAVYLDGGSEWEVGIGTYTSPSTLSRDTILASSNSGSVVTFSSGQKTIWCDYPAGKAVYTDASGDISNLGGAIKTPESIQFDNNPSVVPTAEAALYWDNSKGALAYVMQGADVVQEIGESQYLYIQASANITKGQVVMFTGAIGGSGIPTGAPATGVTDGTYIIGVAAEAITSGTEGFVQTFGILKPVNTTGISTGTILWYDPSVTGGLTATKPTAPNIKVQMAAVTAGNSNGGALLIRVNAGSELGSTDSNVLFNTLTGGNLLIYDQTNAYWKNANLTDGTAISITETAGGAITISNTGVTQATAGTGISVSAGTGNVTITNTAPDQTVSLTGAGTTSISGTYPNFTITSNDQYVGTVTSVAALTLGTTGTDLSSTVANSTTTPVITLQVPTASATNRGALSSTDWTTFNSKAPAVTYTTNYVPYGQGTTTPNQSANFTYNGTTLTAQIMRASNGIVVNSQTVSASYTIDTGDSAMSTGPVTVSSGQTVTVSSGSRWVVL